jgi:hypothetical protein
MIPSTTACCVTILNQQQEVTAYQSKNSPRKPTDAAISSSSNQNKYCTVVENGRVVVKRIIPH